MGARRCLSNLSSSERKTAGKMPALPRASSDLGRNGYTPGIFSKSAQVVWDEWVVDLLILGVRRLFGMRGLEGGSGWVGDGSSNRKVSDIGNDTIFDMVYQW